MSRLLDGLDVVGHDPSTSTSTASLEGKTLGLYFSAHWCPPCRQFTPLLAETYLHLVQAGKPFEVVFVSLDRSAQQWAQYFAEMPWLAVRFEVDDQARERLAREMGVTGIPCLVMVDGQGKVITKQGVKGVRRLGSEGFPWGSAEQLSDCALL